MVAERVGEREPLRRAEPVRRELGVTTRFECPTAALELEHLLGPQRGEALPRVGGRAHLHPLAEPQVVHDIVRGGGIDTDHAWRSRRSRMSAAD